LRGEEAPPLLSRLFSERSLIPQATQVLENQVAQYPHSVPTWIPNK
jgi:hypothetical protein